ncbi:hypothetical protein BKA81DRAFT_373203 [Phyllosticta paracitricarpa]
MSECVCALLLHTLCPTPHSLITHTCLLPLLHSSCPRLSSHQYASPIHPLSSSPPPMPPRTIHWARGTNGRPRNLPQRLARSSKAIHASPRLTLHPSHPHLHHLPPPPPPPRNVSADSRREKKRGTRHSSTAPSLRHSFSLCTHIPSQRAV